MAAGRAPQVASDAQAIPTYAAAGVNQSVAIGSYAGAAIYETDGSLFGAICGIDPQIRNKDGRFTAAEPLLQLLGHLLTAVLTVDRAREMATHDLLLATLAAETDSLTGLHNKRAWERLVAEAEQRFKRFADPTVAVILDLDHLKEVNDNHGHKAGDEYIRNAATALRHAVRPGDIAARLGGDEFGLLMLGCTEVQAATAIERIYTELAKAQVAGSVGWAPVTVVRGFPAALDAADQAMYIAKRDRRAKRTRAPFA